MDQADAEENSQLKEFINYLKLSLTTCIVNVIVPL